MYPRIVVRLVSLFVVSLAATWGCNRTSSTNNGASPPVVGGYSAASTSDRDVVAAAEFAVTDQSKLGPKLKLLSIQAARTQVVAGTNTHLDLMVDDAGKAKPAEVVVYTDLSGVRTVSAWAWR